MVSVPVLSVEVKGIERANESLKKYRERLTNAVELGMNSYVENVLYNAQFLAPFKTGKLMASLHMGKDNKTTWWIKDGVSYGKYQEFGFLSKSGQFVQNPFLYPAVMITPPPKFNI